MKLIKGTWNGKTVFIQTNGKLKSDYVIINTVELPYGQKRTRAYISDKKGLVINWKPIIDVNADILDQLVHKYEIKIKESKPTTTKLIDLDEYNREEKKKTNSSSTAESKSKTKAKSTRSKKQNITKENNDNDGNDSNSTVSNNSDNSDND